MNKPTLAWSNFAKLNSTREQGNSYTILRPEELVELVLENWVSRLPGQGEKTTDRKVVVPVLTYSVFDRFGLAPNTPYFRCTTAILDPKMPLKARIKQRAGQTQEAFTVQTYLSTVDAARLGFLPEPANFVKIVCYSAAALLENNGERSSDADWEIVTILASPVKEEPMHVGTMARNQLRLPGGSYGEYTALQYAEASIYWGQRVRILPD
jgi:hypothetical protein